MSKVYMIFLFLISGAVQLSHTQEPLPKIYGMVYSFEDGRLYHTLQLDEPFMTTVFLTEIVSGEDNASNTRQNIYNIDVTKDGTCYLTCLSLVVTESERYLQSIEIHGVGTCQPNQKIVRWHIKPEQTVDGIHSYDFVFVRDTGRVITEDNLNQLSSTPVIGHKLI